MRILKKAKITLKNLVEKRKSLRWRWHYWIRKKLTMPLANKLIGSNKRYSVRQVSAKGVTYEGEYHRSRYWYDTERITIGGIFNKRKVWHVMYWDKGENPGFGGIEMIGCGGAPILHGTEEEVLEQVSKDLTKAIWRWEAIGENANSTEM